MMTTVIPVHNAYLAIPDFFLLVRPVLPNLAEDGGHRPRLR
jgi:hypothetical protein